MEITFTEYDRSNWTAGDEASLTHCAWHGKMHGRHSENCSVDLVWTVQIPDGAQYSACEKAGYDVLKHYASRLRAWGDGKREREHSEYYLSPDKWKRELRGRGRGTSDQRGSDMATPREKFRVAIRSVSR